MIYVLLRLKIKRYLLRLHFPVYSAKSLALSFGFYKCYAPSRWRNRLMQRVGKFLRPIQTDFSLSHIPNRQRVAIGTTFHLIIWDKRTW